MKRNYQSGQSESATFFVGNEVEHTPAYGKRTLFVTGVQSTFEIETKYTSWNCEHIFFGANHSFQPDISSDNLADEFEPWDKMITFFLSQNILCSLDIPIYAAEQSLEMQCVEHLNFIAQLRVPVPYVRSWNYNTMIKIDDKDFNATNPGVWAHHIHDLLDRSVFTNWSEYQNDTIIGVDNG